MRGVMDHWSKNSSNTESVKRKMLYACNSLEFFKPKREWSQSWKNVAKQWKSHIPGWRITRYVLIHLEAKDWCILAKLWYSPKTTLRNGPLGCLASIPASVPSLSTVHLTLNQKGPHLMLGSVFFLNSDCEPNCLYNSHRLERVVQIETINKFGKGDELLVKYSDKFFDVNECFCSTCNFRRRVADFPLPSSAVGSMSVGNPKEVATKCNNHLLPSSPRRKSKVAKIPDYEQRLLNPMTLDALIPLEPIQDPASAPVALTGFPSLNDLTHNSTQELLKV